MESRQRIFQDVDDEIGMGVNEHEVPADEAVFELLGQRRQSREQRRPHPHLAPRGNPGVDLRFRNP